MANNEQENDGQKVQEDMGISAVGRNTIKLWSVQSRAVLDMIKNSGIYIPDNRKSFFVSENPELIKLYDFVTDSFNKVNGTDYKGLIFSFMYATPDQSGIGEFSNYEDFKLFLMNIGRNAVETFWEKAVQNDSVVFELEYEKNFNPILIDINDFQFLMPPVLFFPPYQQSDVYDIQSCLSIGEYSLPVLPSMLVQAHSGYIRMENIVNVYDIFDIASGKPIKRKNKWEDMDYVLKQAKQDERVLEHADKKLWHKKEFVKEAVRINGFVLKYAVEELRADREIVLEAVKNSGCAIAFAAKEMQWDKEIVMEAVKQSYAALKDVGEAWRGNKGIVLEAVRRNGKALMYADETLRDDKEVVLEAVKQNGYALQYAGKDLLNDKETVIEAIKQSPRSFMYADTRLHNDRKFVYEAIKIGGNEVLTCASDTLRMDEELMAEAKLISERKE